VEWQGGLLSVRSVKRLHVLLGDVRYTLENSGRGALHARRTRVVRGIALKTEDVGVDTWLSDLGAALDERARRSAVTREALARVIG
jgi:hypothetical protein